MAPQKVYTTEDLFGEPEKKKAVYKTEELFGAQEPILIKTENGRDIWQTPSGDTFTRNMGQGPGTPWDKLPYETKLNDMRSLTLWKQPGTSEGDSWPADLVNKARAIVGTSTNITPEHIKQFEDYMRKTGNMSYMAEHPGKKAFTPEYPGVQPSGQITAKPDWHEQLSHLLDIQSTIPGLQLPMTAAKTAGGLGEAAMSLPTGMAGWLTGLGTKIGAAGVESTKGKGADYSKAQQAGENVSRWIQEHSAFSQPQSPEGKLALQAITSPFTAAQEGANKIIDIIPGDEQTKQLQRILAELGIAIAVPKIMGAGKAKLGAITDSWVKLDDLARGTVDRKAVAKLGGPEKVLDIVQSKIEKPPAESSAMGMPEPNLESPGAPALIDRGIAKATPPPIDPVSILNAKLAQARKLMPEQKALYTKTRGERFAEAQKIGEETSGQPGFYSELGALKGPMEKVPIDPLAGFSQGEVNGLFDRIKNSTTLTYGQGLSARDGLLRLLDPKRGIIQPSQIKLLNMEFGPEFINNIRKNTTTWDRIKIATLETANVPRALMASCDLSFMFRQGMFFVSRPQFWSAFSKQVGYFANPELYEASIKNIESDPYYPLAQNRLSLTRIKGPMIGREEKFMGANYAEKIPIIGKAVAASDRAFTGAANQLKFNVFKDLCKKVELQGRNPWEDTKLADDIAELCNTGAGRGNIKSLTRMAPALNAVLFSPRLMMSRMNLINPVWYMKLDPFVRKEALKSLITFTSMTATAVGLAALAGAKVSTDVTNPDFGKVRIGNTRIDPWAGFQPYARTMGQFFLGRMTSSTTGKVREVGSGYNAPTRSDIVGRFFTGKENPIISLTSTLMAGKDQAGKPLNIPKEILDRFTPMIIQDAIDIAKDNPSLLPLAVLGVPGFGLQTYPTSPNTDLYGKDSRLQIEKDQIKQRAIELADKKRYQEATKILGTWNRNLPKGTPPSFLFDSKDIGAILRPGVKQSADELLKKKWGIQ